jgi:GNAT superfamily N-acetyltransferase
MTAKNKMDIKMIDSFWVNDFFGCSLSDLKSKNDIVCPHRYLTSYNGLFVMKINNKFMISAPDELVSNIKQMINNGYDLFDLSVYQSHLPIGIEHYISSSWIGYADSANVKNLTDSTMVLTKTDKYYSMVFDDLQKNCDDIEWSYSGLDKNCEHIAVHIIDNQIASAASYGLWGDKIAHIGIITHPQYRGKGFATNTLLSLTDLIISRNLIPQYRTLCSNISAIKVAEKCDFKKYATHIFIRLQ